MKKPLRLAGELPGELQGAVTRMMQDAFILLVKRAGGSMTVPVADIDSVSGRDMLTVVIEGTDFVFQVTPIHPASGEH